MNSDEIKLNGGDTETNECDEMDDMESMEDADGGEAQDGALSDDLTLDDVAENEPDDKPAGSAATGDGFDEDDIKTGLDFKLELESILGGDVPDFSDLMPPRRGARMPAQARLIYSSYSDMRPSPESKYAPVSTAAYVLLYIVGAIPVVGLIASLIISLCSKKVAYKRAAMAIFILEAAFAVIFAVTFALLVFVFHVFSLDDISSSLGL